ncbi:MAG: hypothetical protein GY849_14870 [Deltaproteobacteria bacterium]|nr:hypothetical protein [Deltaproteobacteria bacterium]
MSLASYTEDTLVQQTTAEHLGHQMGWESGKAIVVQPDTMAGYPDG